MSRFIVEEEEEGDSIGPDLIVRTYRAGPPGDDPQAKQLPGPVIGRQGRSSDRMES